MSTEAIVKTFYASDIPNEGTKVIQNVEENEQENEDEQKDEETEVPQTNYEEIKADQKSNYKPHPISYYIAQRSAIRNLFGEPNFGSYTGA